MTIEGLRRLADKLERGDEASVGDIAGLRDVADALSNFLKPDSKSFREIKQEIKDASV